MESAAPPLLPPPPPPEARAPGTFGERFVAILLRPRAAFAAMTDPDAWFWPAVLMLVGYSLYLLAVGLGTARYQLEMMTQLLSPQPAPPGPAAPAAPSAPPTGAAGAVATWMPFVVAAGQVFFTALAPLWTAALSWTTRCLVFWGMARLLGAGPVRLPRLVGMVGWAWTPLFFQYTLLGLLMFAVPGLFETLNGVPKDPSATMDVAAMRQAFVYQAAQYLSPFVWWNLALCILGVEAVFGLSRGRAAVVVLLPMAVYLIFLGAMYALGVQLMELFMGPTPGPAPSPAGGSP